MQNSCLLVGGRFSGEVVMTENRAGDFLELFPRAERLRVPVSGRPGDLESMCAPQPFPDSIRYLINAITFRDGRRFLVGIHGDVTEDEVSRALLEKINYLSVYRTI